MIHTIFDEKLCMGFGGRYTKKFQGGDYESISVLQVLCADPTETSKDDAWWIIPSTHSASNARVHAIQEQSGKYCLLTVDIDLGNHSFEMIKGVITRNLPEVACRIYSSSSASMEFRKWRILIPVEKPLHSIEWLTWQRALGALFTNIGIQVDEALYRYAQLVYLPNVPTSKRDSDGKPLFYQSELFGNDELSLSHPAWSEGVARERARQTAEHERKQQQIFTRKESPSYGVHSLIAQFNRQYPIESLLNEYGYANDPGSNDWRSPHQSGTSYATRNYGDYWVSLSHSDVDAGLGIKTLSGCSGDAFDLYCHYEFKGDKKKALKELL